MRPLRLKMSAFGPFASTQEIDFSLLGDSPLFLINGPTGSGKTTLLDAISYALYDETTGNERQGREMRCDHAADDLLTEVELEFKLGRRRYRIRRIPRQERPKARGEGTTTQQSEAQLWELDAQGREKTLLVPKKVTAATAEIERLTGLSAEQFRQVMVLPQGRFRELLLADSSQREEIFQQLFQTRIYARLERRLKDRSNDVSTQLHLLDEQARGLLSGMETDDRESLVMRIEGLKQEVERLQKMQVKAEESLTRSRQQVFESRNLQQQFKALETARKKLQNLEDQQPQLESDRERWRLAEQALVLKPVFERLRRARQSKQAAQKAVQEAQQEVRELQEQLEKTAQLHGQMKSREPELERLKQKQQQLKGYIDRAAQLRSALKASDIAQQTYEKYRESEERQQETVKELRRELDRLEKQYESNATLVQQLPDRQRELDALKQLQEKQSELDGLQNRLVREHESLVIAEESKQRATKALQAAEQKQLLLEQAWEAGQAVLLARQLEADSPCPVCGSTAHPHPARAGDVLPDERQRQQARERVETARKLQQEAQSAVVAIQAKLEALTQQQAQMKKDAQALADREPAVLASEIAALTGKVEELQRLRKSFGKLEQNRSGLRQSLKAAELRWQQLQREMKHIAAKLQKIDAKQQSLLQEEVEKKRILERKYAQERQQAVQEITAYKKALRTRLKTNAKQMRSDLQKELKRITARLEDIRTNKQQYILQHYREVMRSPAFVPFRDGPISRLMAMERLKQEPGIGKEIAYFSIMIKALLVFFEIAPILSKMFFGPPTVYATALQMQTKRVTEQILEDDGLSGSEIEDQIALEKRKMELEESKKALEKVKQERMSEERKTAFSKAETTNYERVLDEIHNEKAA